MAKKHKILEAIQYIVQSAGRTDTETIKIRLKERVPEWEYRKSTFQGHLKELIDERKIEFTQDGNKRLYFTRGVQNSVLGENYINVRRGSIYVPPPLNVFAPSVKLSLQDEIKGYIYIYFELHHELLCLKLPKEAMPFSVHISRFSESRTQKDIEKKYPRAIQLGIPEGKISSYRADRPGHGMLVFNGDQNVEIVDFGSTNRTFIRRLSIHDKKEVLLTANIHSNETVKTGSNHHLSDDELSQVIEKTKCTRDNLLVCMSTEFYLVISDPS